MAGSVRCGALQQKAATTTKSSLLCHCVPDVKRPEKVIRVLSPGRRILLASSLALGGGFARQSKALEGDWSSPGLSSPVDESAPKFFKTPGGVKVQQLTEGSGPTVGDGDTVQIDYVCRRSNGYFIYATAEGASFQPVDVPTGPQNIMLGDESLIKGLSEALVGLKVGCKIRAVIPPALGYVNPKLQPSPPTFGARRQIANHRNEALIFEVKMLKLVSN